MRHAPQLQERPVRHCRGSRSSLHYDPYHNLLCMVTGSKRVRCMSPATTQWLYPQPLYGESPNHSAVDFAQPDSARHPLYAEALQHQLSADLQVTSAPVSLPA